MTRQTKRVRLLAVLALAAAAVAAAIVAIEWGAPAGKRPTAAAGFSDCAKECGIDFQMSFLPNEQGEHFKFNLYDHGAGVVVGDYDGDGFDDVLFLNQLGANGLFRNLGDGRFANVTAAHPAVALGDRVCVGGTFADYDNDGDQDLYITSTRGGNVLLENLGSDGFRDVTRRSGVDCVAHSQSAAFFDYDNDGFLDLIVTNTANWSSKHYDRKTRHYLGPETPNQFVRGQEDFESNQLFHNNHDGSFTEIGAEAGVLGRGWSGDVAVFDFDDDGDLDLFITNMFGLSQLLANDGHGHFTEVTEEALQRTSFGAIGCKALDYNNDGRLDLCVVDMHSDMWVGFDEPELVEPARKYRYYMGRKATAARGAFEESFAAAGLQIDYDRLLFGNTLYRNEGSGSFSEVSDQANFETFWPWGLATGDFNNDGYEDVYIPSGMGYPYFYYPSQLMLNRGDGTFHDDARRQGIEPPADGEFLESPIGGQAAARSSRCAATADFDGDGRLDLVVNNFNARPYYFKNRFPSANYVELRLTGTKSNRDAIGALVTLHCGDRLLVRQVQAAGGYLSQSSKTLHFGLGAIGRIDRAEIRWPSGLRQEIGPLKVNSLNEVTEATGKTEH